MKLPSPRRSLCLMLALISFLAACDESSGPEQAYLERGKALYHDKNYEAAADAFTNVLRANPKQADAYFFLGLIDIETGNRRGAFHNFRRVLIENPDHVGALLKVAEFDIMAGRMARARDRIERVTKVEPDTPYLYSMQALLHLMEDDFDLAEKLSRKAIDMDPANVSATKTLTHALKHRGEIEQAIAVLDQTLNHVPDAISLRRMKISMLQEAQDFDAVEAEYLDIIALRPQAMMFVEELARLYAEQHRSGDAERLLRQAIERRPDSTKRKLILVRFLLKHSDENVLSRRRGFEAAEQTLLDFIEADPDDDELRLALGSIYVTHGETAKAERLYRQIVKPSLNTPEVVTAKIELSQLLFARNAGDEEALSLVEDIITGDTSNDDAFLVRARIRTARGNYVGATADLRTVLGRDPTSIDALSLMAKTYLLDGEPDLAADVLRSLIEIEPQSLWARNTLAELLLQQGATGTAEHMVMQLLAEDPDNVQALKTRYGVLAANARWLQADDLAARVVRLVPEDPTGHILLGGSFERRDNFSEAKDAYATALALDPASREALSGLVRSHRGLGDPDVAADLLRAHIDRRPDDVFALLLLGEIYEAMNVETEEIAAIYRKAMEQNGSGPGPYRALARLEASRGEHEKALEVIRAGLDRYPRDADLATAIAAAYVRLGRHEEAIRQYEALAHQGVLVDEAANDFASLTTDIHRDDPRRLRFVYNLISHFRYSSNPGYLDTLGWLNYRMGNIASALRYLEDAARRGGDSARLHYHLGVVYLERGDAKKAHLHLEKAAEAPTPEPAREAAREALKRL